MQPVLRIFSACCVREVFGGASSMKYPCNGSFCLCWSCCEKSSLVCKCSVRFSAACVSSRLFSPLPGSVLNRFQKELRLSHEWRIMLCSLVLASSLGSVAFVMNRACFSEVTVCQSEAVPHAEQKVFSLLALTLGYQNDYQSSCLCWVFRGFLFLNVPAQLIIFFPAVKKLLCCL